MTERKNNHGYLITNEIFVENEFGNEVGFVVGYNKGAPSEYVTWKCSREQDSFITGHYFSTKEAALRDFFERAAKEVGLDLYAANEVLLEEDLTLSEDLEHGSDRTEIVANLNMEKLRRFGYLQEQVYEMTDGKIPLITFHDDRQGMNIYNPFLDVSGRIPVDPVIEYGVEKLSLFASEMDEVENELGISVEEMPANKLCIYLEDKVMDQLSEEQKDGIIKQRLSEAIQDTLYENPDENGMFHIEIQADYRESNEFLLHRAYENRNAVDLRTILTDRIYDNYQDLFSYYENDLLEKAGFSYPGEMFEKARELLWEIVEFQPDIDYFFKDEMRINLLIGTEFEQNSDFSDIQENLYRQIKEEAYAEMKKDEVEYGIEIEAPDNGLSWLIEQQGYTLEDLRKVKKEYDAYFYGPDGDTNESYSKKYELFKQNHSPFLTSVCQELENHSYSMGCLTVLLKSNLDEYCNMFENSVEGNTVLPKEIVIGKNVHLGIFNPWNGSGSCLEIELEKDLVLPNDLIYDCQIEGVKPNYSYSVDAVYGLIGSCWKPIEEIRPRHEESLDIDSMITGAMQERDGIEKLPTENLGIEER